MKRRFSVILNFILILTVAWPWQTAYAKKFSDLDAIIQSFENGKVEIGIAVQALSRRKNIYGYNALTPLNPASTMKALTSIASLRYLGPDYTYNTFLTTDQHYENGINHLYVKGSGDPTITTQRFEHIAKTLKDLGITEIRGNIAIDNSYFLKDPELPSGLKQHMAENAALVLNPRWVGSESKQELGDRMQPDELASLKAELPQYKVPELMRPSIKANPKRQTKDELVRKGRNIRYADPVRQAGEMLKDVFLRNGIAVKGQVVVGIDQGFIVLFEDPSEPLVNILKEVNKKSNNFMAEMVLKGLSAERMGPPGSMQKGALFLSSFLGYNGVSSKEYKIVNGSGLSRDNRISANALTQILTYAWRDSKIRKPFLETLPIAGVDGTLKRRLLTPELAGNVRAKTGTLNDTCALSGYLKAKSGKDLAFTILVNGPGAGGSYYALQEKLLKALYEKF